jgi:redox-sensitive bicupin YhaK (pirin superfamily)
MKTRTVLKTYTGTPSVDGAGVKLNRIFGHQDVKDLDPFLLLDFFDSRNPEDYLKGFPWHPHRGIETITYLIDGLLEHGDSLGNSGLIDPLGCQWMTAGSGIIHQEMPQASEHMLGAQLWLNLPRKNKMTDPTYRDITAKDLAIAEDDQTHVKVIAGTYKGHSGPVKGTFVDPIYLDVSIHPNGFFEMIISPEEKVFLLLLSGTIAIAGQSLNANQTKSVLLGEGDQVSAAAKDGARFLLIAGKPLNEPIAWGGPIVMNTQTELNLAFDELKKGTFIKI